MKLYLQVIKQMAANYKLFKRLRGIFARILNNTRKNQRVLEKFHQQTENFKTKVEITENFKTKVEILKRKWKF